MIRRARRDGREARENEEREKREDEKGSHCFFKSSGYDKLELKYQNLFFFKLIECPSSLFSICTYILSYWKSRVLSNFLDKTTHDMY